MIHLQMLEGQVESPSEQRLVEDPTPASGDLQVKNVTPVAGRFRAAVDLHDQVEVGELLSDVVDLVGQVQFECRTEKSGEVILIRHVQRVEAGASLAVVI